MLKEMQWVSYADNLGVEIRQCETEGKDITGYYEKAVWLKGQGLPFKEAEIEALKLHDELAGLPIKEDFGFVEPSGLSEIRKECESAPTLPAYHANREEAYDKIYGAWLGRCCGCLLGQPIEGYDRGYIVGLLKDTGNYPISYYISSDISRELREKYEIVDEGKIYGSASVNWINNVNYMPEDDDTNYTLIALKVMEEKGYDFTPEDVAEIWLDCLPYGHVCSAERIAYRNFVSVMAPPESASYHNPYREWIGAQIRADLFGYVTPGDPAYGAELAFRDASISHTKNGIYGEMFVAAMLSAAAVSDDIEEIIRAGMAQIPRRSRLYAKIMETLDNRIKYTDWEQAIDAVHEEYDEDSTQDEKHISFDWCHTISNAVIVTIALLYGNGSLEESIGIAVAAGFDTDCNGATVGSVIGMINGAKKLPGKWTAPLNDQIKSGVDGMGLVKISEIAARTLAVMEKNKEKE
ncbi:ADP-ribosylglycohydrolase family protein [Robinsoniella peoriensis]|uniref:ADP-ribosylglycohydrolase n=1 Tax=Robinsoniella peoriensis TaxID=180332 RepID=A0A4U8QME7_9FIRM|nr:ADP-ribosylglycohydrolase family protein [Robinsoniella peoriensis]MDU7027727.1 ADP-ribosylglycohydrolase family protein [Clostridiales bacterium]TLD01996.1 ADP-ribosylglycohydrolase [Robinsoniella peoriensis]